MEFEKIASKNLADYYKAEFEIIKLDWLKKITKTALVNKNTDVPDANTYNMEEDAVSKNLWVPNRNGLFVNIAFVNSIIFNSVLLDKSN